jgi:phage baseplate assembly protein W|tara:strand:+ start:1179 stop:1649 length:471 start_codon:yes stop_codon:yes gene_type:complete
MPNTDQSGAWRNPAGFSDAEGPSGLSDRSIRVFADLDLFFTTNNRTKDINILSDVSAVKRSVRNLVLLNQYEKPFRPEIYSGIRDMLFEPMTPITATILAKKVEDVIENFEPRARLMGVRATPDLDRNAYNIAIEFYVVNTPTELVDLTIMLERLR